MPAYDPAIRGKAYEFHVALQDLANPGSFKANPTIAAGDFKVSIDNGATANLATLPDVQPASGIWVRIQLSATEMLGANIKVQAIDQTATKEWADQTWTILTTNGQATAKIVYGTSGTVWFVGEGGSDSNDGLSYETRLATLTQAITNHAANDVIVLRGAITNNSAAGQLLDGASIVNALGQPRAVVTSSFSTNTGRFMKPGNRSVIRGFKINCTDTANIIFPIGLLSSADTVKTDVLIEDMHIVGKTDAIYTDIADCTNWVIRRCFIETTWDAVAVNASGCTVLIEDNDIIVTGPSAIAASQDARPIFVSAGTLYVRRNRLKASGAEATNYAVSVSGGVVHVWDNIFDASTDLANGGGTVVDYGNNRGSGTGGAPTTSGTITNRKGHYQPDWTTINAPTTTQGLSGTTIKTATDVETDTANIQTRIPAALTGDGNIKSDMLVLDGDANAADALRVMFANSFTVDSATFTPTTTAFETSRTVDASALYSEQVLYGVTGANAGQTVRVTAYAFTNSKVKLTVDALQSAPANSDRFLLIGRIEQ